MEVLYSRVLPLAIQQDTSIKDNRFHPQRPLTRFSSPEGQVNNHAKSRDLYGKLCIDFAISIAP